MSLLASTHTMIETKRVQVQDSNMFDNTQGKQSRITQSSTCPEIVIDEEKGSDVPVYTETVLSNSMDSESQKSDILEEEYILEDLNEEELGEQDVSRRLSIQVLAQNLEDKTQILQMLLHCADLANPTKDFKTYKMWTDKVMEEFWNQGDLEKKLGLSVQAMFDKEKADVVSTEFSKIY